ncbi:hypothetical protein ACWGJT_30085 [Streptomyces xantholiticus]
MTGPATRWTAVRLIVTTGAGSASLRVKWTAVALLGGRRGDLDGLHGRPVPE